MPKPRIVIKDTKNKQTITELIGGNNKVLMVSETLKTKAAADNNIKAVQKLVPNAKIIDLRKTANIPKKKAK